MKKLNALLERADDGLRALLLGNRLPAWLLAVITFAAFYGLMLTRTLTQLAGACAAMRCWSVLVLCLPLAVMLCFAMRLTRTHSTLEQLCAFALCALAMLARVSFIERSSGDYDIYLADWMAKLAAGSFAEGMRANIGEYNVLYQYILFVITRLGVPALYAVKAVSFIGDAYLAGAVAALAGKKRALPAFGAALLLPTLVLNGGMFAQCDSLYAACALWGLALALDKRPVGAAVCFALSLSFKLQSAFILPMVAVLWAGRKLKLREALIFVLTLLAVMLPALLGGKSLGGIIGIYTSQTGLYTGLNYNAASFFGLMETVGLDVYAYGNFAMALAFGVCALLVACGVRRAKEMTDSGYVRLALLMVLLVVFLLPRMHERYFYMAVPLSIALAARRGGLAVPAAAMIELAMLATCWALAVSLPAASLLMLTAIVLVLTDCCKNVCGADEDVI
ncbi:MAG: hypothetical protein IJB85_09310 [Clostridia bacterium]|nr:hypothetical protein [Clostridia bacterium]